MLLILSVLGVGYWIVFIVEFNYYDANYLEITTSKAAEGWGLVCTKDWNGCFERIRDDIGMSRM